MARYSAVANQSGFSLAELLTGILLFGMLSLGVFSTIRSADAALRSARDESWRSTVRIILRENFKSALFGATQYAPAPLFKVVSSPDFLSRAVETGKAVVAARIIPDSIYQRVRNSERTVDLQRFCRYSTGLPNPAKAPPAALAVSANAITVKRILLIDRRSDCAGGESAKVREERLPDVFGFGDSDEKTEALVPILDIYSLSVDEEGIFRRRSLLTGENQPVLAGIENISIQTAPEQKSITITFTIKTKSGRISKRQEVTLPVPNRSSYDYLDLIW